MRKGPDGQILVPVLQGAWALTLQALAALEPSAPGLHLYAQQVARRFLPGKGHCREGSHEGVRCLTEFPSSNFR
jgi:hypothetical protein